MNIIYYYKCYVVKGMYYNEFNLMLNIMPWRSMWWMRYKYHLLLFFLHDNLFGFMTVMLFY